MSQTRITGRLATPKKVTLAADSKDASAEPRNNLASANRLEKKPEKKHVRTYTPIPDKGVLTNAEIKKSVKDEGQEEVESANQANDNSGIKIVFSPM